MIEDDSKFHIYEGHALGEGMASLFQRASLVVLAYLSASTSEVLMIAYSFGKPVVGAKVGCLPEYIEAALLVCLWIRPMQLAEEMIALLTDDALRHRNGREC